MAIKSRLSINRQKNSQTILHGVEFVDHAEAAEKRPDFLRPSRGVEFPGGASVVPGQQPDNREGNGFDLIILNKLAGKGLPPML